MKIYDKPNGLRYDNGCSHCGKPLTRDWVDLELNCETGEWAEPGTAPWSDTESSQGCFSVGTTCAKKLLRRGA